jgi:hypothetical protein
VTSATSVFSPDKEGVYSTDKILERLLSARDHVSKQSNRFLLISFGLSILYLVKLAGLRADFILFEQKVFELPYGLFLFLILAQVAACLSLIKAAEERSYDLEILAICKRIWPTQHELVYESMPDSASLNPGSALIAERAKLGRGSRFIYFATTLVSGTLAAFVLMGPIFAGIYYLADWRKQIVTGNVDLQYYSVCFSTVLTFAWVFTYQILRGISEKAAVFSK